jgi:membrane protease YdiL (CAAX protease family)
MNVQGTATESSRLEQVLAPGSEPSARRKLGGVLVNRFGHLHALWRALLYALVSVGCFVPVAALLFLIGPLLSSGDGNDSLMSPVNVVFLFGMAAALALAGLIMLHRFDHRPTRLLGLALSRRGFLELAGGLALGSAMLGLTASMMWAAGWIEVSWGAPGPQAWSRLGMALAAIAGAATVEELLLRGYLFQVLAEGTRSWIAVLATAAVFALLHNTNQGWVWSAAPTLFLHGVLLGVAYLRTRSLWFAIGIHLAWNFTQGPVWGLAVSGVTFSHSLLVSRPAAGDLLSGGSFGAEGSVAAWLVGILVVGMLVRSRRLRPSPDIEELWRRLPRGWGLPPVDGTHCDADGAVGRTQSGYSGTNRSSSGHGDAAAPNSTAPQSHEDTPSPSPSAGRT